MTVEYGPMAYLGENIDAALAAAAGDDPALFLELRAAFVESVERQLNLLSRARCDGNWHMAALRLKGLSASFHDTSLMQLADEAIESAPGEPRILRQIRQHIDGLAPEV